MVRKLRWNLSKGARAPIASRTASATRSLTRSGVANANAAEPLEATAWRSTGTLTLITAVKIGRDSRSSLPHGSNVFGNALI